MPTAISHKCNCFCSHLWQITISNFKASGQNYCLIEPCNQEKHSSRPRALIGVACHMLSCLASASAEAKSIVENDKECCKYQVATHNKGFSLDFKGLFLAGSLLEFLFFLQITNGFILYKFFTQSFYK